MAHFANTMAFAMRVLMKDSKILWLKEDAKDCILGIFVQAGAKSDAIVGEHGDWLKIRVAAPRTEGMANEHLVEYLSKIFHVAKRDISIQRGEFTKYKLLKISNMSADDLLKKINANREPIR